MTYSLWRVPWLWRCRIACYWRPSPVLKDVGTVATIFAFLITVALLLWSPGLSAAQPLSSPTQDPVAGSRVFGSKGCAKCHAVGGVGGQIGPDLAHIPDTRSFYALAAAMWNHYPTMIKRMDDLGIVQPYLSPRETGDLIAFLHSVNYFDPSGDPEAGRRLFKSKRCVACHQVGGTGGVAGPNLDFLKRYGSPIFVASAMWNHGPAMTEAMRARAISRPTFEGTELVGHPPYLETASPAPVREPIYVLPGRADEGRRLFAEKRCAGCHSVRGEGGRVGPDLAERALHLSMTEFAAAMWNKVPAMMKAMKARDLSVPQLLPQEMADLVAYLYSVRYFAPLGDSRMGEQLVATRGCQNCHAVRGKGGEIAPDLARVRHLVSPDAVISAMWNHALVMEKLAEAQQIPWPTFSPQEMADLVAYLRELGSSR